MRKMTVLFGAVLAAVLVMAAVPFRTLAADSYRIWVSGGASGTVDGQERAEYKVNYGESFSLSQDAVQVTGNVTDGEDVKYTVMGFREAGKEDTLLANINIQVTGDAEYVVAYGLTGELASYTIHYVARATGAELGSDTYYAYPGDKPVATVPYFENYVPEYAAITGTLNPGSNDWTMYYTSLTGGAAAPAAEGGAAAEGGGAAAGGAAAPAAEGGAAAGGEGAAEGGEAVPGEAVPGGETPEVETPGEVPTPAPIIDIDESTGPAGDYSTEEGATEPGGGSGSGFNWLPVGIVGGVVVVGGATALIVLAAARKKKKG